MLVYILLVVFLTLGGIPLCRIKHGRLIYCIIAGIVLFMAAGLRRYVGTDYNSYATIYIDTMSLDLNELAHLRYEKGYLMITKLLSTYFVNYQAIFFVTAFIITAAVMCFIYFYCDKPYLGVFCFLTFGLFFNSMNFIRQIIAACIILYAYKYIQKKDPVKFLVLIAFASCFHLSALIMIPFYFLLRIKMNWVTLGVYAAGTAVFMIFSWQIIDLITDYVYKSYDPLTSAEVKYGTNPFYTLMFGIFFFAAFLLREDLINKDPFNIILINCSFFNFFFEVIGLKHAIISRFALLFSIPAAVVLVPQVLTVIIEKCRHHWKKDRKKYTVSAAVSVTVFTVLCMTMYGYMMAMNYNQVMPYQSIFTVNNK